MVAVIDYDAGNIRSVEKAFQYLGQETVITRDREEILAADHVVLPGVGAFGDAMEKLENYGLVDTIREAAEENIPFLGICLGLQLLFADSEESPGVPGLNILPGHILRIPATEGLKIPHIGWNSLTFRSAGSAGENLVEADDFRLPNLRAGEDAQEQEREKEEKAEPPVSCGRGRLFEGIPEGSYVYFVHSYYLKADDEAVVKASCEYGIEIHASVERGNVFACQFHPEKSGETGLKILKNFLKVSR